MSLKIGACNCSECRDLAFLNKDANILCGTCALKLVDSYSDFQKTMNEFVNFTSNNFKEQTKKIFELIKVVDNSTKELRKR